MDKEIKYCHDPVCKMYLEVDEKTPFLDENDHIHYFCSEECLNIYRLNPENYKTSNK